MRILIDIGHPAHVHLYRNFIVEMKNKEHTVFVSVKKNGYAEITLLKLYGIPFVCIGSKPDSILRKALCQIKFDFQVYHFIKKNKIEIGLGTSVTNAHVSRISKLRSIIFDDDDDDVQPLFVKYVHPYCDTLLSPDVLNGKRKLRKTIFYPSYHELAYLHPNRFKPDNAVLDEVGIKYGSKYFIMRFNVFKAHHDNGIIGLSLSQKLELINILKPYGRIFITTERNIEPELSEYQMKISPEKVHSLLAYSTIFIGDSQTMSSEAAVLGVPSLRCNSFAGRISYLEEEERKYKLTYSFKPEEFDKLKLKLTQLLKSQDLNEEWQKKRQLMLMNKIDLTAFMVWFVENYPLSIETINNNPDLFQQFN